MRLSIGLQLGHQMQEQEPLIPAHKHMIIVLHKLLVRNIIQKDRALKEDILILEEIVMDHGKQKAAEWVIEKDYLWMKM